MPSYMIPMVLGILFEKSVILSMLWRKNTWGGSSKSDIGWHGGREESKISKKRWHNLWTTPNQNLKLGWVKARLYSVLFQGFWWVSYTLGGFLNYVFLGLTKLFQKNCKQWRVSRSLLLPFWNYDLPYITPILHTSLN